MQKDTLLYLLAAIAFTTLACWLIPKMMGLDDTHFWMVILLLFISIIAQTFVYTLEAREWLAAVVFILIFSIGIIGLALSGVALF